MIGIRQYKLFNFTINCRKDTKDAEAPFPLKMGEGSRPLTVTLKQMQKENGTRNYRQ